MERDEQGLSEGREAEHRGNQRQVHPVQRRPDEGHGGAFLIIVQQAERANILDFQAGAPPAAFYPAGLVIENLHHLDTGYNNRVE